LCVFPLYFCPTYANNSATGFFLRRPSLGGGRTSSGMTCDGCATSSGWCRTAVQSRPPFPSTFRCDFRSPRAGDDAACVLQLSSRADATSVGARTRARRARSVRPKNRLEVFMTAATRATTRTRRSRGARSRTTRQRWHARDGRADARRRRDARACEGVGGMGALFQLKNFSFYSRGSRVVTMRFFSGVVLCPMRRRRHRRP